MARSALFNDRKDWPEAFRAVRQLLRNPGDTVQVFRVMKALNGRTAARSYRRLLETPEGGRIAYRREELVDKLTDGEFFTQFAPGSVGAAYRGFLERTGFSAQGLAAVSKEVHHGALEEHPIAWMGRRERDIHDIWHVLTGYRADEPLGELCLVAFSFAQSRGLGWAFIAVMGTLNSIREPYARDLVRAVWEGYVHGRKAAWLHAEDLEALFAEPLEGARRRMNILQPIAYEAARMKWYRDAVPALPC